MKIMYFCFLIYACLVSFSCDSMPQEMVDSSQEEVDPKESPDEASIESVTTQGNAGAYTFSVSISSPDTGCEQYADWWEVISDSGELIYRRILAHSHVDEQPFIRSGSPVPVSADQQVWIRVHMNNTGYSNLGMKGSVDVGFEQITIDSEFAADLDQKEPLPSGCAF